ncbi:MAG: integrin alpha, partial [Thermoanaerobaculia bacterium]|nr:integrin alpha [Thermoanaerobaculia bacterium]
AEGQDSQWIPGFFSDHLAFATYAAAEPPSAIAKALGHVRLHQKISQTSGGFTGNLALGDGLGSSIVSLGDLDGDGVADLAAGAPFDDDGGLDHGAVWILFLEANSRVKTQQKISDIEGGFAGILDADHLFGLNLAPLGDLDGDGTPDLAVSASRDNDGGFRRGAVWILFLHPNGTVKAHQKISATEGAFTGLLEDDDRFGRGLASLGDLDGDGNVDLAVGASRDDDGGPDRGAVRILYLHSNGTVKAHQKISATAGGFTGTLEDEDFFGYEIASLGDLDRDGVKDLAVASIDDDGGMNRGAVWILFLDPIGTVKSHQKISATEGDFTGTLDDFDRFGTGLGSIGDLDCDGIIELAIGAEADDDGSIDRGAVWIPFLSQQGRVRLHTKISDTSGGFSGHLDNGDQFGASVLPLGDLDGDGHFDLAVGASGDDDGGVDSGAIWILFLDGTDCPDTLLFRDGFESGTTTAWSQAMP